jgi:hypothetical protein
MLTVRSYCSCLTFVNSLVTAPDNLSERVALRDLVTALGLGRASGCRKERLTFRCVLQVISLPRPSRLQPRALSPIPAC